MVLGFFTSRGETGKTNMLAPKLDRLRMLIWKHALFLMAQIKNIKKKWSCRKKQCRPSHSLMTHGYSELADFISVNKIKNRENGRRTLIFCATNLDRV
jgi:hypothetical protein